ncbi:hypothetical protein P0E51_11135 [Enterococcus faecalis]|uniref:hypothetical protein n=1 Tax=Enterococcus faecalis TaxID=1351 RepID=UPI0025B195A0|nr:hypothetical protein [Enterococcus faecalis]MDN3076636.1 hypothetical protein [Enterococcus faecalis]
MEQYKYNVSGEYNDWFEFRKGNILIHNGTLLGIVTKVEDEILLRVNYGTEQYFYSIIKCIDDLKVIVPREPDLLQKEYKYQPIIFDRTEFTEFIENIYFNEKLLEYLPEVNKKDLVNIWMLSNPIHKNYKDVDEMKKDILDNILFFSEDNYVLSQLKDTINTPEFMISQIPENHELVIIYIDNDGKEIYEWNSLIKIDNRIYLKIDDSYYLNC